MALGVLALGRILHHVHFLPCWCIVWIAADHQIPAAVTKEDIQAHFKEGTGTITEVKLMNGFGFIEYQDPLDARDVVPGKSQHSRCRFFPIYADSL